MSCLDDKCEEITYKFDKQHTLYEEIVKKITNGKELHANIIIVPVQYGEDFVDEYLIESYKESN
jgi:hypothetical protein